LATAPQKYLPQRKHPIRRGRHLCLNSYTALGLSHERENTILAVVEK